MYAVIETGGKQYKVAAGDKLKVEKIDSEEGEAVDFNNVLMHFDGENLSVGKPMLEGVKVNAKVLAQGKAKKIKIIKFKRRKHHMKSQGHRQLFTEVEIISIDGKGGK
jgi:large subunit ribosomal protein L21